VRLISSDLELRAFCGDELLLVTARVGEFRARIVHGWVLLAAGPETSLVGIWARGARTLLIGSLIADR